ncbi:hypothetical protein [Rouxiella badensis]|jgi:hypothetical protein|uniref:hypothetical protein n=1 Tax=Rouxiella badensis TaxID=1646377 RepID=UPI003C556671
MALTGSITINSQSLPDAYVVVSSITLEGTMAQAMFSLYATVGAYIAGALPIITYPGYIPYSMSQVPLDVVETSTYIAGLFPGFTRVTTADKTSVSSVTTDRAAILAAAQASAAAATSSSASTSTATNTATSDTSGTTVSASS